MQESLVLNSSGYLKCSWLQQTTMVLGLSACSIPTTTLSSQANIVVGGTKFWPKKEQKTNQSDTVFNFRQDSPRKLLKPMDKISVRKL